MDDCVVVGGGPAGLNAALVLGRARRRVTVFDAGAPRNNDAHRLGGFLSRDGADPAELLRIGRAELAPYDGVTICDEPVRAVRAEGDAFRVEADGLARSARTVLLATGVRDVLPDIPGAAETWGRSLHSCPYCDGWEERDRPLAVLVPHPAGGAGPAVVEETLAFALVVRNWSRDLVVCTDGGALDETQRARMERAEIGVRPEAVRELVHRDGILERIEFVDGPPLSRAGVFIHAEVRPHTELAAALGCERDDDGLVLTDDAGATSVPGVFAAGDASMRRGQVMPGGQVIQAAGGGSRAAIAVNDHLTCADEAALLADIPADQ